MQSQEPRDHYLPTLDGWRAVAISMVVASHAFTIDSARGGPGGALNLLIFRLGTLGVMLFFAISGFLICTRLLIQEETLGSTALQSFYIRRVFRILPAAYFYLVVIGGLAIFRIITVNGTDFAIAALFVSNYIPTSSWFTGHFWSLALEEHFYLLWPPLLVKLGRRRAALGAVALIGITVLCRFYSTAVTPAGADLPGYTQLRLDAFMCPCILAILLRKESVADRFRRVMTPMRWCGLLVVVAIGIASGAVFHEWREPQRLLQSIALPVIVATTVARPGDWIGRVLQLRPFEWLGRVSYSVYLWQQLVFGFAPRTWHNRVVALPILLAAILVLAEASRRYIELPMIRLGKRWAALPEPRMRISLSTEIG